VRFTKPQSLGLTSTPEKSTLTVQSAQLLSI
jgi:hypothetical protein